jgi:hypothetical protein
LVFIYIGDVMQADKMPHLHTANNGQATQEGNRAAENAAYNSDMY